MELVFCLHEKYELLIDIALQGQICRAQGQRLKIQTVDLPAMAKRFQFHVSVGFMFSSL